MLGPLLLERIQAVKKMGEIMVAMILAVLILLWKQIGVLPQLLFYSFSTREDYGPFILVTVSQ